MTGKFVLASRSILWGLLGLSVYYGQKLLDAHLVDADHMLPVTILVNMGLRLITRGPITWRLFESLPKP